jgi:maleylacetoacetate isomerase
MLVLHTYWRSSAAYRARIALNLKGLAYEPRFVNLVRGGGEQHGASYRALNPQGRVPTLEHDGQVITQSLAIIEYLQELFPQPSLLPSDAVGRARVRALALIIAADVQPLQNTSVTTYLKDVARLDKDALAAWLREWITRGLTALEARLAREPQTGRFCHGDAPTIADCCLVPQVYSSRRFGVDPDAYPTITRIARECADLPAFVAAAPEQQADRE